MAKFFTRQRSIAVLPAALMTMLLLARDAFVSALRLKNAFFLLAGWLFVDVALISANLGSLVAMVIGFVFAGYASWTAPSLLLDLPLTVDLAARRQRGELRGVQAAFVLATVIAVFISAFASLLGLGMMLLMATEAPMSAVSSLVMTGVYVSGNLWSVETTMDWIPLGMNVVTLFMFLSAVLPLPTILHLEIRGLGRGRSAFLLVSYVLSLLLAVIPIAPMMHLPLARLTIWTILATGSWRIMWNANRQ